MISGWCLELASEDPAFVVRRAGADDVETLVALRRAMQEELLEPGGALSAEWEGVTREYLRRKVPSGEFLALVAEADGGIIGTSGLIVYEAPPTDGNASGREGYIMNMYTRPEYRGRGIAGAFLERLLEHLRSAGAGRVWLRASPYGDPVYRRLGFEPNAPYMQRRV